MKDTSDMAIKENTPPTMRLIGQVKWYGGYNSKTQHENKYGFLDSTECGTVFAHESGLICAPSVMKEGLWVTFRLIDGEKGTSAVDVDLAENEVDSSTIRGLLMNSIIPIGIRVQACFHIPLEESHPLIPLVEKTLEEYNSHTFKYDYDFPDTWKELDRKSSLYKILPEKIKRAWFYQEYPSVKQTINVLSSSVDQIQRDTAIYGFMSPQDKKLALSWTKNGSDYEKSKMLSARAAELVATEFFTEIGKPALDISIHQITGESNQWKSHDLLISSSDPVDVKNSRTTINSNIFVEYTIKSFKNDSQGKSVIIFGILSPYLTIEEFESTSSWQRDYIKILGETTKIKVTNLEREFSKRELTVYFGDFQRWPIWIFNNDLHWFSYQSKAIKEFRKSATEVRSEDWNECKQNSVPAFLISGMELPKNYREKFLDWQNWYVDKIVEKSKSGGISLPWIYLFTFQHFLDAITNISSAESKNYSPKGYYELLFYSEYHAERPASLIDPAQVLMKLIDTLVILWSYRHSANLVSLRSFSFRGEGLLSGINQRGRKVTVLAYCGGFIKGKGKCGHSPLIIGKHDTCDICQMLICDKCNHCSNNCKREGPR